ncbi:MAG: SlyX family protein [Halioglobus sp.]|nr:SlyX family protein [Halioglobus sp.]
MTTETDKLREMLVDLQSQLAFQEDAIAALDGVVSQQQHEIILLRRQVELLGERQKSQAEQLSEVAGGATEKPPHY